MKKLVFASLFLLAACATSPKHMHEVSNLSRDPATIGEFVTCEGQADGGSLGSFAYGNFADVKKGQSVLLGRVTIGDSVVESATLAIDENTTRNINTASPAKGSGYNDIVNSESKIAGTVTGTIGSNTITQRANVTCENHYRGRF